MCSADKSKKQTQVVARVPHSRNPALHGRSLRGDKAAGPGHLRMPLMNQKWLSVFLNLHFGAHRLFNILCGKIGSHTEYHAWKCDDVFLKSPWPGVGRVSWTDCHPPHTTGPRKSHEWTSYGYSEMSIWQRIPAMYMKWAHHFKANNWQRLCPVVKFKLLSEN